MGKGIEKLDARDLVSLEALNQEAATFHKRLTSNGDAIRKLLSRFKPVLRFATKKFSCCLPKELHFKGMKNLSECLERLINHRKKLAAKLRKPSITAPAGKLQEEPSPNLVAQPLEPALQEIRRPRFH